jgi:tetratricopeptide (TPR) repeat protein
LVRKELRARARLGALIAAAALLAGCAATYPPSPAPAPPPPRAPQPTPLPGPVPAPDQEPAPEPAPAARPDADGPTLALLQQSERSADSGDIEQAIAYVERAIRLDSRDVDLWLRLARLQLRAERPAAAEQIAQRAIALARDQHDRERQGWLLVADAREAQGDREGAARIRDRWMTYRG